MTSGVFRPRLASRAGLAPRLLALAALDRMAVTAGLVAVTRRPHGLEVDAVRAAARAYYDLHYELAKWLDVLRWAEWGSVGRVVLACQFHKGQDAEGCPFCEMDHDAR